VGESCGLSGVWSPDGLPLASASGTRTEVVTCLLQRGVVRRYRTIRGVSTPGNP
jgi:hypothetical protein